MDFEPDIEILWDTEIFCQFCKHYNDCPKEWYCRTFIKMVMENENMDNDDTNDGVDKA